MVELMLDISSYLTPVKYILSKFEKFSCRGLGIVLIALAFCGAIGFDDRLHQVRMKKTLILPSASIFFLGSLGVIGGCAFHYGLDQNSILFLSSAIGSINAKSHPSIKIWKARSSKHRAEKRTLKKQNGRLQSKVIHLKDALASASEERRLMQEKADGLLAQTAQLQGQLADSQGKVVELSKQHKELKMEHDSSTKILESLKATLDHEVSSLCTKKERSPFPTKLAIKFVKVALAGSTYRATVRIMETLTRVGMMEHRIPCATSLGNWICKCGLALFQEPKQLDEPYILVVDHCKAVGGIKVFVALAITRSSFLLAQKEKRALCLEDMTFLEMIPMKTSNAAVMCATYKQIISKVGKSPEYILSDKGSDLIAGLRLYRNLYGDNVEHLHDYSHMAANLLKAHYKDEPWLAEFTSLLHSGSAKLRLGEHASLAAPSIRGKARFMNIKKQLEWAVNTLNFTKGKGRPAVGSRKHVLQQAYPDLRQLKKLIEECLVICNVIDQIAETLKKNGFNEWSYKRCLSLLNEQDQTHSVIIGLLNWLNQTKMLQLRLKKKPKAESWNLPLPISSDPIESLFSRYKQLLSRMPIQEPTKCLLALPLLTGNLDTQLRPELLDKTTHKDLNKWISENLPDSQIKKRKKLSVEAKEIENSDETQRKSGDKIEVRPLISKPSKPLTKGTL